MLKIQSNIKQVIERVEKLRRGIPLAISRAVNAQAHWRSRGRTIASETLLAHAGEKAELVPAFVDQVVALPNVAGEVHELTFRLTAPPAADDANRSLRGGDYTIPLIMAEAWRAAFHSSESWVAYQVIYDWVSSHSKDLTVQDMEGELPGGVINYQETARKIYNIIFRRGNTTLLETEAEAGPHAGGGGARLLDFFAEHPLTSGLVTDGGGQQAMVREWLAIVLAAWRQHLPQELSVRIREEIAKI